MSLSRCGNPIALEVFVDYWASALAPEEEERVELHVFGCSVCTTTSREVAALARGVREHVPTVLTKQTLAALEHRGLRIAHHHVAAGSSSMAPFPEDAEVLVLHLDATLPRGGRVDCELLIGEAPKVTLPEIPFDREAGAILLTCQREFLAMFPDGPFVVTLTRIDENERREIARYELGH